MKNQLEYTCRFCGETNTISTFWRWFIIPHFGNKKLLKCKHCKSKRHYMKRKDCKWSMIDWPQQKENKMITAQEARQKLAIRNNERDKIIQGIIEKEKSNLERKTLEAISSGETKAGKYYAMSLSECTELNDSDLTSFARILMAYLGDVLGYQTEVTYNYFTNSCIVYWSWKNEED